MNPTFDSNIAALLAHELDPAFAARAALILRHVQPTGAGRILDVGCGRGFYTRAIAALYPQAAVVGVDYSNVTISPQPQSTDVRHGRAVRACRRSIAPLCVRRVRRDCVLRSPGAHRGRRCCAYGTESRTPRWRVATHLGPQPAVPIHVGPAQLDVRACFRYARAVTHLVACWHLGGSRAPLYSASTKRPRARCRICARKPVVHDPALPTVRPLLALWDRQEHHRTRTLPIVQSL